MNGISSHRSALRPIHALLAVIVAAVWGTNFVVIEGGLAHLPPLLFAGLRFLFVAFPAILIIRKPAVAWSRLALYGLLVGVGQFGLLYIALRSSISPGLASLVVQCQVFITVGMAALIEKEPVRGFQLVGLALAAAGLAVVALAGGGAATPLGLALVLLAALSWAVSNLVVRSAGAVDMLAFVVWSSLFAVPPLLGSAWMFEGGEGILNGLRSATPATWAAVAWQSVGNTMFGYGVWAWLLTRYPAATVAPTALLVPVFGISASALLLGERLEAWKLLAAGLIILGLVVNLCWERLARLARSRDL